MISNALRAATAALALFAAQDAFEPARPDYRWSFPRDHWAHPAYRTEWWYFTGQLAAGADTAPRFGYQFTFFKVGVVPPGSGSDSGSAWNARHLIMGHAAITDLRSGRHVFSEVLYRAIPLFGGFGAPGDSLVAWSRAPAGTDGRWVLRWTGAGFAFAMADARQGIALDLHAAPERPLVLQGPNGFSRKAAADGYASLYYSMTRLATTGTLSLGAETLAVRGRSWMDKEFSSAHLAPGQTGWDWFSLQLDDGRDIMLYVMRDSTGAVAWSSGTVARPNQAVPVMLAPADFTVRAHGAWTSPASRARYPSRWTVTIPGERLTLDVAPLAEGAENRSAIITRLFYWEGAVIVRDAAGRPAGRGYVELTGYGSGLTPAI